MKTVLSFLLALKILCSLPTGATYEGCYFNDEAHRVYACGKSSDNEIALTFDDGPHPDYTP